MEHVTHATARAAQSAPTNDEAHGSPQTVGPRDKKQHRDFDTEPGEIQALTRLRAQCQSRGYSLHELADSTYLVSRWALTRHLQDLHQVARFVRQIGGANV
jgi:hypothetical protein